MSVYFDIVERGPWPSALDQIKQRQAFILEIEHRLMNQDSQANHRSSTMIFHRFSRLPTKHR